MYLKFTDVQNFSIKTWNQDIVGHLDSLYFDNLTWNVRYLVVNTILFSENRSVLISPVAVDMLKPQERMVVVNLKTDQIENSPNVDYKPPLSRQKETELAEYYEWPPYWREIAERMPNVAEELADSREQEMEKSEKKSERAPHIRDADEIIGYTLKAPDGRVGTIDDFIFDSDTWHISFAIVDTSPILPGHHVMLPPTSLPKIDSANGAVLTEMSEDNVKKAPQFTDDTLEKLQV